MAGSPEPTLVGSFASQEDASIARERLEAAGIAPITVEQEAEGVWMVHAPVDRKAEALAELQVLEQRRRGPAI